MQALWHFVRELRRRRVFRTVGLYVVGAWVVLQVAALAFQTFDIPDNALRFVWLAAIAGFPLALVFGWRYDITPDGITRTPVDDGTDLGLQQADYVVIAALVLVAVIVTLGALNEIRRGSEPWYTGKQLATAIAVMPLENLSGDVAQEYLVAGIHDALITTLSRITRLRVTSRFSARRASSEASLQAVAKVLGVDKILSGSVTREGDQVRVNVALVDVESEQQLWAESYMREFDGLISMQNEIASAVAREVKVQLSPEEQQRLATDGAADKEAYEAYLRGTFQLRKSTPRGYRQAIDIFTKAVENHPTNALAYAGLAIGYSQLGHSPFPVKGAYPRAREAAARALEFDPDLAEAHLAVGMYKMYYEWDFVAAEESFLRALEISPSLVDAHYHYAWLLELLLRDDEALRFGEYTKKLNPLSPFYAAWLAEQYRDAEMFDEAIIEAESTLALNPEYPVALVALGQIYADLGQFEPALYAHEKVRNSPFWAWAYASTLAATGDEDKLADVMAFLEQRDQNAFTMSLIFGAMQDSDETLHWLQVARDDKIPWFPWLLAWYPQTQYLHDDPRTRVFAEELGIEFPET